MRIEADPGAPEAVDADLLAVPLVAPDENLGDTAAALDERVGGRLTELVRSGEARADAERVTILRVNGGLAARRVALVGVGERDGADADSLRNAAGAAAREAAAFG